MERAQGPLGRTGKLCWSKMINEALNEKKKHSEGLWKGRPARVRHLNEGWSMEEEDSRISYSGKQHKEGCPWRREWTAGDPRKWILTKMWLRSCHMCAPNRLTASHVIQSHSRYTRQRRQVPIIIRPRLSDLIPSVLNSLALRQACWPWGLLLRYLWGSALPCVQNILLISIYKSEQCQNNTERGKYTVIESKGAYWGERRVLWMRKVALKDLEAQVCVGLCSSSFLCALWWTYRSSLYFLFQVCCCFIFFSMVLSDETKKCLWRCSEFEHGILGGTQQSRKSRGLRSPCLDKQRWAWTTSAAQIQSFVWI